MMYRAVFLRRAPLLAVVLVTAMLAAVLATVTIAVAMHRTGDVMMVAYDTDALAVVDSLAVPHLMSLVPPMGDGPLPVPSL